MKAVLCSNRQFLLGHKKHVKEDLAKAAEVKTKKLLQKSIAARRERESRARAEAEKRLAARKAVAGEADTDSDEARAADTVSRCHRC